MRESDFMPGLFMLMGYVIILVLWGPDCIAFVLSHFQ
jgi:hypothetical protein